MNGNSILFATSSSNIDRKSYPLLKLISTSIRQCGDTILANAQKIEISGHTDSRGSEEMNLKLSDNRAKSVRDYLLEQGVRSSVLISKGYGESNPIADNKTAAGRKQNRRIQFTIQ
jgi:outer membrane protein OmpA-like peptidoglycan-associated protein